jgi:hypothetical protein
LALLSYATGEECETLHALYRLKDESLRARAGRGTFATSVILGALAQPSPALVTTDLSSSTLIVVQCKDGRGALGHYAGTDRVDAVLAAVGQMLAKFPGAPQGGWIDTILLGGGEVREKAKLRAELMDGALALARGAEVVWKDHTSGEAFGSCLFLPKERKVALWRHRVLQGTSRGLAYGLSVEPFR